MPQPLPSSVVRINAPQSPWRGSSSAVQLCHLRPSAPLGAAKRALTQRSSSRGAAAQPRGQFRDTRTTRRRTCWPLPRGPSTSATPRSSQLRARSITFVVTIASGASCTRGGRIRSRASATAASPSGRRRWSTPTNRRTPDICARCAGDPSTSLLRLTTSSVWRGAGWPLPPHSCPATPGRTEPQGQHQGPRCGTARG